MTVTEKNPKNGRKIIILPRKDVKKVFAAFQTIDECLNGVDYNNNGLRLKYLKNSREKALSTTYKKDRKRIEKVGILPTADFAPFLGDSATLLKQRLDHFGIYFQEADGGEKGIAEIDTGVDFVLEVGSFGLAYNDEYGYDAKGHALKIAEGDIVGSISKQTAKYWKKRFADDNDKNLFGVEEDASEFLFSPVANGTMIGETGNVMKVSKWFQNGDGIFNVLMVLYTIKKKEKIVVENKNSDSEDFYEKEQSINMDIPFMDVQLNVYYDGEELDTIRDTIDNNLSELSQKSRELKKRKEALIGKTTLKNAQFDLFSDTAAEMSIKDMNIEAAQIEQEINSIKLKSISMKSAYLALKSVHPLIQKGFGFNYRPKDKTKLQFEVNEAGQSVCLDNGKAIKVPKNADDYNRKVIEENGKKTIVYSDDNGNAIYINGKKVKIA